jgi:hypothetical protein
MRTPRRRPQAPPPYTPPPQLDPPGAPRLCVEVLHPALVQAAVGGQLGLAHALARHVAQHQLGRQVAGPAGAQVQQPLAGAQLLQVQAWGGRGGGASVGAGAASGGSGAQSQPTSPVGQEKAGSLVKRRRKAGPTWCIMRGWLWKARSSSSSSLHLSAGDSTRMAESAEAGGGGGWGDGCRGAAPPVAAWQAPLHTRAGAQAAAHPS